MASGGGSIRYDFRSDTVTVPTPEMKEAMMSAPLGDDVYGEDPTVIALETKVAKLLGKEAALFCTSGTMTNQLGLRLHLNPLTEALCDVNAHIHLWEAGGASFHCGAVLKAIDHKEHHLTAEMLERHLTLDHSLYHKPLTRLIEIENTCNGKVFPLDEIQRIAELAKKHQLRLHLDGARLWNACAATGISPAEYCEVFDTVSVCLSKGLGAPVGSLLVGSQQAILQARHYRKAFGGGWRQAGILAAAGIYALDHHLEKLKEDHSNAKYLAQQLAELGFEFTIPVETNMLWLDGKATGIPMERFAQALRSKRDIAIAAPPATAPNPYTSRIVIHHQTPREAVDELLAGIREVIAEAKQQ